VARDMLNERGTDIYIRKIGLIVMNENFEVIGETDQLFLGSFPTIFVGKKGIYEMLGQSNESRMTFNIHMFE
jgi:hypothetical protein